MNDDKLECDASAAASRSSRRHRRYSGRLPQSMAKNQQSPVSEQSSGPTVTWEAWAQSSSRCSSAPLPPAGMALFHSSFMLSPAALSELLCTDTTCRRCYQRRTSAAGSMQWQAGRTYNCIVGAVHTHAAISVLAQLCSLLFAEPIRWRLVGKLCSWGETRSRGKEGQAAARCPTCRVACCEQCR